MPLALTLLDGVRWYGEPVVGDRPQALLAALALGTTSRGRAVLAENLVMDVWGEDVPANPAKALQVLVSRVRTACGPEAVVREGDGYRLGPGPTEVDALVLRDQVRAAHEQLDADPAAAGKLAAESIALVGPLAPAEGGPLAELRAAAGRWLAEAVVIVARADSRTGAHAVALPALVDAWTASPGDEGLLVDLLRSEASVHGPGSALSRYERYRSELADRVGSDPGPDLQRTYAELLALDSPVREGVQYDATSLLGRDDDVRRLHGLLAGSRVVSVLGPGGLGKTRLAHVIGREYPVPTVHFVELVGVTVAEDLIGEVGSALGVRDSVSGRRALTPQQRADVRARIAQHLDASPSLLILDNCEHIVDAVADLVAYLVATTRDLRVLTTTRSPLTIAAERVYPLGALNSEDSVRLFEQRAVAARPEVNLVAGEVAAVVARLDGLPLAIELAAAKVRVMGVADIADRLADRFALLRGGDRSAPERHQTLLAVIDWSWSLLAEPERRALRWLSLFHDGFTLAAAEAVLGPAALEAVQHLADQSLVSVVEAVGGVRYRMLETVREFGRVQLAGSGEEAEARAAQRSWALSYSDLWTQALIGPLQFDAVDAFRVEENNLADVLRQALVDADPEAVVRVLAGLGTFWTILGDHARVFVLAEAVSDTIHGWVPVEEHRDAARVAIAVAVNNAFIAGDVAAERLRSWLRDLGPGSSDPRIAAMVRIMTDFDLMAETFVDKLTGYAEDDDRYLAVGALQWISHIRENTGDPVAALDASRRALALTDTSDGPWQRAILHTQVAQLAMQLGRREDAVTHAAQALPVLERLGARDDTLQLRALMVLFAIADGDLDAATAALTELEGAETEAVFGGGLVIDLARSELLLARGQTEAGLAQYLAAVHKVRNLKFPGITMTGLEPWVLFGEATALTAYAEHSGPEDPTAVALFEETLDRLRRVLDPEFTYLDYPVCGVALFALGARGLRHGTLPRKVAVRLLVLADRFAYNRSVPSMAWARIVAVAEEIAPGTVAAIQAEYGERRGPELLEEARATVALLS